MNKYNATPDQIRQIKAAIRRHNMRSVTWESVAARGQDSIEDFLVQTAEAWENPMLQNRIPTVIRR